MNTTEETKAWISAILLYGSIISFIVASFAYFHWWGIFILVLAVIIGIIIGTTVKRN